jgi:hypothetical protein
MAMRSVLLIPLDVNHPPGNEMGKKLRENGNRQKRSFGPSMKISITIRSKIHFKIVKSSKFV